ncbi:hypothetical protein [Cupriavidus sp. UYPR2.512]|uniref:hypothetical protein n=1 Tax=Cupriavidus sp. UYPR2.512 TaxID=1080187 RepID=UPI0003A921D7|nr:hypothetical protein [Cupriavidus sp. UYPR2.512]UIF87648.1 hypothetical protein KAF44_09460 [Cupriavidus necator]
MQIREEGPLVTLLRTRRDPHTGRRKSIVAGTFRASEGPSPRLLATLDPAEQASLRCWLDAWRPPESSSHRSVLDDAHRRLTELVAAIDTVAEHLGADAASAIGRELEALARALHHAQGRKPRRPPKPPHPLPDQADLLSGLPECRGVAG